MALHRSLIIILFTAVALPGLGQSFVPLEIRYSRLPQAEVKQADNETFKGLERGPLQVLEGHFGFPIRLKKHGVLFIPKISYARYYQSLNLWEESQDALGNTHLLGFNFSGIVPVSSRLSFTGSFGVDQAVGENSSWSLENNLYKFAVGFLFKLGDAHKAGISVAYTQILDVPMIDIDKAVRTFLAGRDVSDYRDQNSDQYDIVLRYDTKGREFAMEDFDKIYVKSHGGSFIPLLNLAKLSFQPGESQIDQQQPRLSVPG